MPSSCSSCNAPIPDEAKFCPVCGTRVEPKAAAAAAKVVAAPAVVSEVGSATVLDGPRAIAGRFMADRDGTDSAVGVVYAGSDLQNQGAAVRVLVVAEGVLPSAALVDRTLREWKQLSKVTSPRVSRVIDQGKLDDGKVYVATDPARGVSLAELVGREGALSVERARKLVSQIGEALSEAQKVGVIHRDVAPRNIFVAGAEDEVTVVDFGVAEAVTDKIFGSPAYLSPEQAEGKPVDQRSNIYSLGAVIYFMVTGKAPFEGDSDSLLAQHASATPQLPSVRRPGLPAEIDRIVMKALEKSGGRRHLTLRQLVTEMEGVNAGAPAPGPGGQSTILGMPAVTVPRPTPDKTEQTAAVPEVAVQRTMMAEAPVLPPSAPVTAPAAPVPLRAAEAPAPAAKTMMAEAPAIPSKPKPAAVVAASAAAAQKKGGGFRETAWFKKGEIEEELAKAAASTASEDPLAASGTTGQHATVDDSQLTAQDQQRLSLKTGATQMMQAIKVGSGATPAMPGERMDESEMIAEIDRSKRWFTIAGIVVGVVVLGLVVLLFTRKSEGDTGKPAAQVEPTPSPAPAPAAAATPAPAPSPPATVSAATLLGEAEGAMAKQNWVVAVDALLRASRADGAEPARVKGVAVALDKALGQTALAAKKRKDRVAENEARALAGKLRPLLPAVAPAKKPGKNARRR